MKKNLLKNSAVQTLVASLICIVLGLFLGYLVLLLINPVGAGDAILTVIKNFWTYNRRPRRSSIWAIRSSRRRLF